MVAQWLPNRLAKELEASELKHQLAIQRHEDEVADLPLGWNSAVIDCDAMNSDEQRLVEFRYIQVKQCAAR